MSNGNRYIMGTAMYKNYPVEHKTFLWKNEELLDLELEDTGLCLVVQGNEVYCLLEKNDKTFLLKNGEIIDTGLKIWTGFAGSHFQILFVDGTNMYVIGQEDGVAKIWKNGEEHVVDTCLSIWDDCRSLEIMESI